MVASYASYRGIAKQYNLFPDALSRHRDNKHIHKAIITGHDRANKITALKLETELNDIINEAGKIREKTKLKPENIGWGVAVRAELDAMKVVREWIPKNTNGTGKPKGEVGAEDYIRDINHWPRYLEYLKHHAKPPSI